MRRWASSSDLREYPDAAFRDVTAPNADTLYTTAGSTSAKEPYVLSLPDVDDRYYLMPMLDGWTDVFQVPGKRTTGTRPQKYAITGPGWKGTLPEGVTEYKSPTNMVWILGRIYCTGTPEDYKAVHALQDKYHARAARALTASPTRRRPGKVDPSIDMKTPVREQVNELERGRLLQAAGDADEGQSARGRGCADGREDGEARHRAGRRSSTSSKLDPASPRRSTACRKLASRRSWRHFKKARHRDDRTAGCSRRRPASTAPTTCSARSSPRSASAPIGRRTRSIRPRRWTPTASPTAAPTST